MGIRDAEYWKKYREENKERLKSERLARYKADPEKYRKRAAECAARRRDKIREYHTKWRAKNSEKLKTYYGTYMERHGEKLRAKRQTPEERIKQSESHKKYREANPEFVKSLNKEWYEANKHTLEFKRKARNLNKTHYWKNPERSRILGSERGKRRKPAANARVRERRATDIQFMLAGRVRATLNHALRRVCVRKSKRTMEMVGCSIDELRLHIESQFTDGLSWENRNTWHVDHHVPVIAFDLTDEEEMKWAFNFRNLRPLRCQENHQKSDTLPNPLPDWLPAHIATQILGRNKTIVPARDSLPLPAQSPVPE